jgi:AcrR family transcriptional regulator
MAKALPSEVNAVGLSDTAGDRRGLVERQIYEHALVLFAEKGFASTSLQDIAESMGTSRPKLYYYIRTKEEILERLVRDVTEAGARATVALQQSEGPPEQRLRNILEVMVNGRMSDPLRFRVLDRCEGELPENVAATHLAGKRAFLKALSAVLAEGMHTGAFRPGDETVAAFALIGMSNWVAWWYSPRRGDAPAAIAQQLIDTAMCSVLRADSAVGDPYEVITHMREELGVITRMLSEDT